jgi:hypothetical protein
VGGAVHQVMHGVGGEGSRHDTGHAWCSWLDGGGGGRTREGHDQGGFWPKWLMEKGNWFSYFWFQF